MLLASKVDLDGKREVPTEDGEKVILLKCVSCIFSEQSVCFVFSLQRTIISDNSMKLVLKQVIMSVRRFMNSSKRYTRRYAYLRCMYYTPILLITHNFSLDSPILVIHTSFL